jgi:rhomboid protease GluP
MTDSASGGAPPPDAPAPAPAPDPKAAEARALAEFGAVLRLVTPRIGVVKALIAVNVAVYLLMVARGVSWMSPTGNDLVRWGANFGPRTLNGELWRLVTNVFLHFGALHLGMNMVALWSAGPLVERIFGPARLAALYAFAGATASLASVAVHPQVVSAGASGAVFGVYGALGAFLLLHRGTVPKLVLARLGRVAGTFIVYNVVFGLSHPAIDNAAHLGGLAGGALAGALLARPLLPDRPRALGPVVSVLVAAALLVTVAPRALPAPADLQGTLEQFGAAEARVLDTYNALINRAHEGKLQDDQMAVELEKTIIPQWRAAHGLLLAPKPWTPEQKRLIQGFERYAAAREKTFELMAKAARSELPLDRAAFEAAQAETKQLVDELNASNK